VRVQVTRPRAPSRRPGRLGLTILELLVAMAVLGLLLAIVPPRLNRFRSRWRLRAAAEEVAASVLWARNAAALEGRVAQILYDVPEGSYWIRMGQRSQNVRRLPRGVDFEQVTFGERRVTGDVAACSAYPDGTLDAHEVLLRSEAGRRIRIRFKRLIGEPSYEEEIGPAR